MRLSAMLKQDGVSLLEVLIALVTIAIGIMGISAMQVRTMSAAADTDQRSVAMLKAQDLADRMRANRPGIAAYLGNYDNTFCDAVPAKVCADGSTTPAANCSSAEVANFDVWDVLCAADGGAESGLVDWSFSVACDDPAADCSAAVSQATISSNWYMRSDDRTGGTAENADAAPASGNHQLSFSL